MSTEAKAIPVKADASSDREFVKGLGLTSATMLVMGSMIGSGIFIVSAEIGREVGSPALLIGAWAVAGFMTIVAALADPVASVVANSNAALHRTIRENMSILPFPTSGCNPSTRNLQLRGCQIAVPEARFINHLSTKLVA